jgi:hypothetical protein
MTQDIYTHCIDGREDFIGQQIEGVLDRDSRTRHIVGLLAEIFRTLIQFMLRGAGEARTHDRRIMRSPTWRCGRAACTDTTEARRWWR